MFALILAAGTSSRMGTPKQLLDWGGKPLLEQVIRKTLTFHFPEVVTVVGHQAEEIQQLIRIKDDRFRWVVNQNYAAGQSTSLLTGLANVEGRYHSAMVFLGDQPLIAEDTIRRVLERGLEKLHTLGKPEPFVVRPSFQGIPGHPVFLGNIRSLDLTGLKGDEGAKGVICTIPNRTILSVEDSGAVLDIDTPEAYERVRRLAFHSNDGSSNAGGDLKTERLESAE
ncbi:molybdenum cofactor cytidylyltransferase [Thermoflavimicrobium dichotomicum]|uniref:Molybdenum cofactor cytidylyltransferase n=1 Tax=Thermoflavimicrobium dichotomicum TaxID=46223 RepID=A0A1I3KHD6_9BACL|nr:molybdenum cofactor cytidylyltransferase [Thermoflavimicrobium dichotomicum]